MEAYGGKKAGKEREGEGGGESCTVSCGLQPRMSMPAGSQPH